MGKYLTFGLVATLLFSFFEMAYAQNQFYMGATAGAKYSLSTCRNENIAPIRSTGVLDGQGGMLLGYGNSKLSIESAFIFGTLGIKHVYDSPLINPKNKFKVVYRTNDLLTIQTSGYLSWRESENANLVIGSSLGVNMNIQYSKNLAQSVVDQEQSMQGDKGIYILNYDDLVLGREDTNFSISPGFFAKWKFSPRFDLRTEVGLNLGIDQLNARAMFSELRYVDSEGQNLWGLYYLGTTYTYSKGDHFFCNVSVLYRMQND